MKLFFLTIVPRIEVQKYLNHLMIADSDTSKQKKISLYKSRNLALKKCKGSFITFWMLMTGGIKIF